MKIENLSFKTLREDRQFVARASILVALLVITALGINLAQTSTPCYNFLVSHQGIVSSVALSVGLVALMVFWPEDSVRGDSKVVKSGKTKNPSLTSSLPKMPPPLTLTTAEATTNSATPTDSLLDSPLSIPTHHPSKPSDSWRPFFRGKVGESVEALSLTVPCLTTVEEIVAAQIWARNAGPRTVFCFYNNVEKHYAVFVKRNGSIFEYSEGFRTLDDLKRKIIRFKEYDILGVTPALKGFLIVFGDRELVQGDPASVTIPYMSAGNVRFLEMLYEANLIPEETLMLFKNFDGKVEIIVFQNQVIQKVFDTLEAAREEALNNFPGFAHLTLREREIRESYISTSDEPNVSYFSKEEIRGFLNRRVPTGHYYICYNRETRKCEIWQGSSEDRPEPQCVCSSYHWNVIDSERERLVASHNYVRFMTRLSKHFENNFWPRLFEKEGQATHFPLFSTKEAMEVAMNLKQDFFFYYRIWESDLCYCFCRQGPTVVNDIDADRALRATQGLRELFFYSI